MVRALAGEYPRLEMSIRRLLGSLLLASSIILIAAGAPSHGTPAPQATASPLNTPPPPPTSAPESPGQTPVILVYPFDVQSGADPKIGQAIAQILAQEMAASGGVNVLNIPQNVKRTDFLDFARSEHADFYLSGYVTPIGEGASVVEQVVSVDSGVILFSQTAQVQSVADVASQSLQARAQILAFVDRTTQDVQPQPSSTPEPSSTNGANVPIKGLGNIVGSVFHHKGSATPTPVPTVKPDRGVIVAPVTGATLSSGALKDASNELYFAMNRRFTTQMTTVTSNIAQAANSICGSSRDNTIATGVLSSVPQHRGSQVAFTLQVYTCFGAMLDSEVGKADSVKKAIDTAVTAYATAHPDNS
jgi:TolB-like protein